MDCFGKLSESILIDYDALLKDLHWFRSYDVIGMEFWAESVVNHGYSTSFASFREVLWYILRAPLMFWNPLDSPQSLLDLASG